MLYDKQYMKMENDKLSQYTVCCFFLILSATFSALTVLFRSVLATVSAFLILGSVITDVQLIVFVFLW